jgi:hypothetical protein
VSVERTLLAGVAIPLTAVGTISSLADGPRKLLGVLGWSLPPGVDDIGLAGLSIGAVGDRLTAWVELTSDPEADEGATAATLAELAIAVGEVVVDLSRVELSAPQDYLDRTGIVDEFLPRLLDLYLLQSLAVAARPVFDVAALLGLVELRREPADPARFQVAHLRHVVHWDRFATLVTDPGALPRDVYGWGTTAYDARGLVANLGAVLQHLAIGVRHRDLGALPLMRLHGGPPPAHPPVPQVFLPLTGTDVAGSSEAGLTVFGLPPTTAGGPDGGLGLAPYARGTTELRVPLSKRASVGLAASGDLGSGIALVLRPDTDPALRTGLNEETPGDGATGAGITVDLTFAAPNGTDPVSLLAEDDLSLTGRSFAAAVRVAVDDDGVEAVVRLTVTDGRLVVTGTGLPFLDALLPDDGLTADFDADLSYSSRHGLRLSGQAALTVARIVARRFGPLTIDQVDLSLGTADGGLAASAGIAATLALGPVDLSVTGVGVRTTIGPGPGNLGAGQLSVRATPPTGIGVSIDAEVVTGGGFVAKQATGDYLGALELQLGRIGVKAIGVFSPGRDWSMLVLLYARIPPVQIGFGFTLDGIGGLVGLQRGVDVSGLAAAMKTGGFDDLLFPADPVGEATRIISRLRTLFPPRPRCLTIGPMVDIHWGKPTIITARLAVLLQLDDALGGGPLRLTQIVVVGQLRVAVGPTEQDPDARVLLLIIDVLGFWNLAERRYGFLARLRDSSVAGIDLTGSLAVWGEYGDHPRFLLAAGGFNARFKDVPTQLTGTLDRLTGSFSVGRFEFALNGYFAVTPATIQAGLNLSATAKIGPVGLRGELGLEVLIYRRPRTHFIFDFRFVAEVTYRGRSLAGVKVAGTIEGPGRWHVVGKVSFSILWWDISKSFDESWGTPPPRLTERVDVSALLAAELAKPENWSAEPPVGSTAMVSLALRRGETTVRAHPLGRFVFTQQVAPFGLTLEKFGDADVAGTDHFEIEATLGGRPIAEAVPGADARTVREHFARAQFLEVSEEDRMTKPAYEQLDAGLAFSSGAFEVGEPVRAELAYETSYLDLETGEVRPEPSPTLPTAGLRDDLLQRLGRFAAAGRAPERQAEQAATVRLPLTVTDPPVVAADRGTLDTVEVEGPATTAQMVVEQRVRRLGRAETQTVEDFELVRT